MTRSNAPQDLGARLRIGDVDVLELILKTHGPPIVALLRQRFSGPLTAADLEDVLSVALFRMWQQRLRFEPEKASLRVWFFRIAENVARDVFKHGWHKARQLELTTEPIRLAEPTDRRHANAADNWSGKPEEVENPSGEQRISNEQLHELVAMLPEAQRRIVLADAESRDGVVSSLELAQELGIPQSTVRVYRRRALERLRREIRKLGYFEESNP